MLELGLGLGLMVAGEDTKKDAEKSLHNIPTSNLGMAYDNNLATEVTLAGLGPRFWSSRARLQLIGCALHYVWLLDLGLGRRVQVQDQEIEYL
jgi:hypothetical protein